jgi:hypothetical protein
MAETNKKDFDLDGMIKKALERSLKRHIEGKVGAQMLMKHTKTVKASEKKKISEISDETLKSYIPKSIKNRDEVQMINTAGPDGRKAFSKLVDRENGRLLAYKKIARNAIKKALEVKEEFPTNSMGSSSSTAGTGPIDTFDPLLGIKKKIARRKKPVNSIPQE